MAPGDSPAPLAGLAPLDLNGVRVYLRPLSRRDIARLKAAVVDTDLGVLALYTAVVARAVCGPDGARLLTPAEVADLPGGVIDTIAEAVLQRAGFTSV